MHKAKRFKPEASEQMLGRSTNLNPKPTLLSLHQAFGEAQRDRARALLHQCHGQDRNLKASSF